LKHKWAADIKPGDVLVIRGEQYVVQNTELTPTQRHIKVTFDDGVKTRFHVGNSVGYIKPVSAPPQ
jgi:hypothetical protein